MNRDTPIPSSMSGLPIKGGYPVPYVADWTGEADTLIEFDQQLGQYVVQTGPGGVGDGEPIFGRQNPVRQRECMLDVRCQVCHGELTDLPWFIAGWVPNEGVELEPNQSVEPLVPVIEEPPLCTPCARYAVSVCPGLNRSVEGPYSGLTVYKTYSFSHQLQAFNVAEFVHPVVQFVLASLDAYTKYTSREFLELTK